MRRVAKDYYTPEEQWYQNGYFKSTDWERGQTLQPVPIMLLFTQADKHLAGKNSSNLFCLSPKPFSPPFCSPSDKAFAGKNVAGVDVGEWSLWP